MGVDGGAVHRLCLLELGDPGDALTATGDALAAIADGSGDLRPLRLTLRAITAARWRRRLRLLGRGLLVRLGLLGAQPPQLGAVDLLAPLRGRERTVLALELATGLGPADIAAVLELTESEVRSARIRGLRGLGGDDDLRGTAEELRRRATEIETPAGLDAHAGRAGAARRRRLPLSPRRLLSGDPLPALGAAVLVAAIAGIAGASAGLLGLRPAHAPVAAGAVPPARALAAAAYDPERAVTVLFGGEATGDRLLADTWVWDGAAWHEQHPEGSPPPRRSAQMAWDPSSRRILLFGGEGPATAGGARTVLRDTWAWDGTLWTPLRSVETPPGRLGSGPAPVATDATTGDVLLVGDPPAPGRRCGLATWRWTASGWTELRPRPSPRSALTGRLAYAPGTGGLVLVTALPASAGCGGSAAAAALWTWDGVSWTEQHSVTALGAERVVDGQLGSSVAGVLVPGGRTFFWDGSDWHDDGPDGPGPRSGAAVAYDPRHRLSILFGGCCAVEGGAAGPFDDTWTWDGSAWVRRS